MKRILLALLLIMVCAASALAEGPLQVGGFASDWSLPDGYNKIHTMQDWAGKVLLINYNDPDEKDMNEHFTDAVKKEVESGVLKKSSFKGIGIADCKASWKPDGLIRTLGASEATKYDTVILFDYNAFLREAWGLKEDSANAILLDKNRVCRAIVRGRVPDNQVEYLLKLATELQDQ